MLSASLLAALLVLLALAGGPGARRAAFGPLPAAIDGQRVKAASSPSPVFAPAAAAILGLSTGEPSLAPGPSSPDDTSPAQREGAPKGGSGGGGDRGDDPTEEPEPEPEPPGEGPDEEPRPEPDEDAGKPNGGRS